MGIYKTRPKNNEIKASKGIVGSSTLLFFVGLLFGYYIITPLSVHFFSTFQMSEDVPNRFTINSYMTTVTKTTFYTGLMFLLPVVISILSKLGIMTPQFLRKYRKHALVIVLILSAFITPPDFISQVIVALPIMGLYEISILISARINKRLEYKPDSLTPTSRK